MPLVLKLTAFYVSINAFILLVLGVYVMRLRRRLRVGYGDGGNIQLQRAIRAHGNTTEYVPIALILLFLAERLGGNMFAIHAIGLTLTLGRVIHPYGLLKNKLLARTAGMTLTWLSIILGIVIVLSLAFTAPA